MRRSPRLIVLFLTLFMVAGIVTQQVSADTFNQNNIIDDAVFNKVGSMDAASINVFLNQFPNSCISPNNGFLAPDPTGYNPTNGFLYGGNVTAGQVIYDSAQAYGINPQVLLTTLQKEQSLVDGGAGCSTLRYAAATGYGCPDGGTTYNYSGVDLYTIHGTTVTSVSGTCVNTSLKVGFSQQVIRAAWLLEFGLQRSEGNIGWAVINGSWNNSDDPQSCYSGPMTQGTWQRCPSGATTYYDGYTTIDATAVHMDDGATASLYWYTPHFPGNQNFFTIFTNWFGTTILPVAFKTPTSGTVYIQTSGYKFSVPSMALLQDFGINPNAIQTISQATADSIPTPAGTTGLSTGLGYLVKSPSDTDSDGASVYLISVGKRYQITSMQQFGDFGFTSVPITYLPLSYIYSLSNGGNLSNFVYTPSHNVFQVSGGTKQMIFDYATYQSLNPGGYSTAVSGYTASTITSGAPITNREVLVGLSSGTVYLLDNGNYYTIPSIDTYNCWGFSQVLGTTLYKLSDDSYIAPISSAPVLSCLVNTGSTNNYALNGSNKISLPASYGIVGANVDQNLSNLISKLPLRTNQLSQVIKSANQPTVWYLENGMRKPIPSLTDLKLLGFSGSQIDTLPDSVINSMTSGELKLGVGQVVKSSDYGAVYVVTSNNSRALIASSDDFMAYNYSWSAIESFPSTLLDQTYPYTTNDNISKYLVDQQNVTHLMDAFGCYTLDSALLTSYGQSLSSLQANQKYQSTLFPYINLASCKIASTFVKSASSDTVYWVDSGQLHSIPNWSTLVSKSGTSTPYIITLSSSTLATIPIGAPL